MESDPKDSYYMDSDFMDSDYKESDPMELCDYKSSYKKNSDSVMMFLITF